MIPQSRSECRSKCRCRYHRNHRNHRNRRKCVNRMSQQQPVRVSRLPTSVISRPPTLTQQQQLRQQQMYQQQQQQQHRSRLPQSVARSRVAQQVPSPTRLTHASSSLLPCRTPQQRMSEKGRGSTGITSDGSALPRPGSAPADRRMCTARAGPCDCAPDINVAGGGGRPTSAGSGMRTARNTPVRPTRLPSRGAGTIPPRCQPTCPGPICELRAVASGSSITAEATIRRPQSKAPSASMKQQTIRSRSVAANSARSSGASGYSYVNPDRSNTYGSVPNAVFPPPSSVGGTNNSKYAGSTSAGSNAYDSPGTTSGGSAYGTSSGVGGNGYARPVSVGGNAHTPVGSVVPNGYNAENSVGGNGFVHPSSVAGHATVASVGGNGYANQGSVPGNGYANQSSVGGNGYGGTTRVDSTAYAPKGDSSGNVYGSTATGGGTFGVPGSTGTSGFGALNGGNTFTGTNGPNGTSRVMSTGRVPAGNAESAVSFTGVRTYGSSNRQPVGNLVGSASSFSAASGVSAGVGSSSGVGLSVGPGRGSSLGGRSAGVVSTEASSSVGGREVSFANRVNCLSALGNVGESLASSHGRSSGNMNCPTSCTAALAHMGLRAGAEAGARAVAQAVARAVANVDSEAAALAAAKIASRISPTKKRMLGKSNLVEADSTEFLSSTPNAQQGASTHRGTRHPGGRYSPTMLRLQETPNAGSTLSDEPPWEEDIDLADELAALDIDSFSTTNARWTSPTSQRLLRRTEPASRGAQGAKSLGEVGGHRTPQSSSATQGGGGGILDTDAPWEEDTDLGTELELGDPTHDTPLLASVSAFEPRNNSSRMNPYSAPMSKRIDFQDADLDDITPPWDDLEGCEESDFCGDPLCDAGLATSSRSHGETPHEKQHRVFPKTPLPSTLFNSTLPESSLTSSRDTESGMFRPLLPGSRLGGTTPAGSGIEGPRVGGSGMSETGMAGQRMTDPGMIGSGAAGSRIRESGLATTGSRVTETGTAGSRTRESGLLGSIGTASRVGESRLGSGIPSEDITNVSMASTSHQSTLRSPSQALASMAENLRRQEKHEYETLNKSLREMQIWRRELISDFQRASLAKFTKSELEMIDKVEAPSEITDASLMEDTLEEEEMAPNLQSPPRDPMEEPDLIQFSPPGTLDLSAEEVHPALSVFSRGMLQQLNLI